MTQTNIKKFFTRARISRFLWYIHCLIFAIVQVIFINFDGDIGRDWDIQGLNSMGEWVVFNNPLREWVQIYNSQPLNGITATWGIVLIILGLLPLINTIEAKKEKSIDNSITNEL